MKKPLAVLFVAVLCASTAHGQDTTDRSPRAGRDHVSLTAVIAPASRRVRLSRRKVTVILANHTPAPLVLDRRHLYEGVMVQLWDRNHNEVGKLPVSPPRPPEDGDRVIVGPGEEYKVRFTLGDLYEEEFIDKLNTGPYTVQFCYLNSLPGVLDGSAFSLLEICSEPQTVR